MKEHSVRPSIDMIRKRIFPARDTLVMLDIDIAWLYGVSLQSFLQMAVKEAKLPDDFLLRLSADECPAHRALQDSFLYAVTERGILLIPALFPHERYIDINIALLRAVAAFRSRYRLKPVKAQGKLN